MRYYLLSIRQHRPTPFRPLSTTRADPLRDSLYDRKFPVEYDRIDSQALHLLRSSLQDFLPPRPKYWNSGRVLFPGHHLVYFPPAVPEHDLLADGTDLLHAPDPSYKYRLWAGGDVSYPHPKQPQFTDTYHGISLKQEIIDVKTNAVKEGRIWVKIRRSISFTDPTKERRSVSYLSETPIVIDNRWLVFYKSKPSVNLSTITPPPTDPYYSHSLRTTSALLFRFSALTFNAHAVHIDPEYTKKEYGLPGLLVHGPLTFVLMMEVLVRGLDQYEQENGFGEKPWKILKVEYRNVVPVFVGEEVTIGCGPVKEPDAKVHGTHHPTHSANQEERQWEVWVQKMINGQPGMCVKATAVVARTLFPTSRAHGASASGKPDPMQQLKGTTGSNNRPHLFRRLASFKQQQKPVS